MRPILMYAHFYFTTNTSLLKLCEPKINTNDTTNQLTVCVCVCVFVRVFV
jgi:hypothetical protein